jgi:hypothetical protein
MAGAILGVILRHQLLKPFVNKIEEEEENEGEVKWEERTIKIPEENIN